MMKKVLFILAIPFLSFAQENEVSHKVKPPSKYWGQDTSDQDLSSLDGIGTLEKTFEKVFRNTPRKNRDRAWVDYYSKSLDRINDALISELDAGLLTLYEYYERLLDVAFLEAKVNWFEKGIYHALETMDKSLLPFAGTDLEINALQQMIGMVAVTPTNEDFTVLEMLNLTATLEERIVHHTQFMKHPQEGRKNTQLSSALSLSIYYENIVGDIAQAKDYYELYLRESASANITQGDLEMQKYESLVAQSGEPKNLNSDLFSSQKSDCDHLTKGLKVYQIDERIKDYREQMEIILKANTEAHRN